MVNLRATSIKFVKFINIKCIITGFNNNRSQFASVGDAGHRTVNHYGGGNRGGHYGGNNGELLLFLIYLCRLKLVQS